MKINKLKLKNIRSYIDETIAFPEGSILLSGDIGSGKSTALLSMDFALFGLQKGSITGSSLLRNGEREGSVELNLDIDGKDVLIKRNLKKEGDKIVQSAAELIIDNEKAHLTSTELKVKILELLNYPKDLLTKTKSLIYRYTVYTPQEEMKHILLSDKDSRLDVLRRIFGIDRYKRIKDNSKIFVSYLKEKKKECQALSSDLLEKQAQKETIEKRLIELKDKINTLTPDLNSLNDSISVKKNNIQNIEIKIKEFQLLKEELYKINVDIDSKKRQKERNIQESNSIYNEIKNFEKRDLNINVDSEIKLKENEILLIEKSLTTLNSEYSVLLFNKNKSLELKDKISKLDKCPTCNQNVGGEYKSGIFKQEDDKLIEINKELESVMNLKKQKEEEFANIKLELNNLRFKKQDYEVYLVKYKSILEKEKKIGIINTENENLDSLIFELSKKKQEFMDKIELFGDLDSEYNLIKKEIDELSQKQKSIEIQKSTSENELNLLNKNNLTLELEINKKLKYKDLFLKYSSLQSWIEEDFFNMMDNIERQIMFKIHNDFSELFKKWFDILMNNDIIKVRLDEEFTPLIEQNGYDIDYDHISGGERTSVALSYRLALNQVINNLITNIKTKDLLILDEPTDGFSSEQLDRIRVILDDLNLKQIIIVSHDPKIESFVDSVIRINKLDHISNIK